MKKFLALFLALVMIVGLTACGKSNSMAGGVTAEGKVVLSIGIPTSALVVSHEDNALTKWIEEQCNVELKFVEYAGGSDLATQIVSTIAARQELPDILFGVGLTGTQRSDYGREGYFVDLKPYFDDKEGASKIFWDRIENELSAYDQRLVINSMTDQETGGIYAMPAIETSLIDKQLFQVWINKTWLDKLNLEMPTDNESLYKVLMAFKTQDPNGNGEADEIPLYGSQEGGLCASAIDFLINTKCYYNRDRQFVVDDNGKLEHAYVTDEYREGLKFARKLYKEGLLTTVAWTASKQEMKQVFTPTDGLARAGVVCAHLTVQAQINNKVMYEYVPMPYWGNVVMKDTTVNMTTIITEDCENVDKAFEVLMTLFSWDGSMRQRYGEYQVNWTDADPGAKSDMGLDAAYKLIHDPINDQTSQIWSKMGSMLNILAEGEAAQISEEMTEWMAKKSALHAASYANFLKAQAENNPKNICPKLFWTDEEDERRGQISANINDRVSKAQTEFIVGQMNIESDAEWNAYIKQLDDMGRLEYLKMAQDSYNRG